MAEPGMPLQNRVTPEGEIVATAARGTMMGNRGGCLHRPDRTLAGRRWVSRQWICCLLSFNGRHRQVMTPGRYTELFFLDEATALAAGHRPCFECRRKDFLWFAELWGQTTGATGRPAAGDIDRALHAERLTESGAKRTHAGDLADLPSGTFVRWQGAPHLLLAGWMLPWSPTGYGHPAERPSAAAVEVLTPRSTVAVLSAGFCPTVHPSAHEVD